ncbi:hypothetical protein SMICM304S_09504 [Streptomyces microflavus]
MFQVLTEFQSDEPFRLDLPGVEAVALDAGPDKASDLTVYFTDRRRASAAHLEYNAQLFDQVTVDRFFTVFRDLLTAAVERPGTPLSLIARVPAEGDEVPESGQGPLRPVLDTTVHDWVARQAAENPGRSAVVCGDVALTYRELDEGAERLAAALTELGRPRAGRPWSRSGCPAVPSSRPPALEDLTSQGEPERQEQLRRLTEQATETPSTPSRKPSRPSGAHRCRGMGVAVRGAPLPCDGWALTTLLKELAAPPCGCHRSRARSAARSTPSRWSTRIGRPPTRRHRPAPHRLLARRAGRRPLHSGPAPWTGRGRTR